MKIANYIGRCMLVEEIEDKLFGIDLDYASHGRFGPNPISIFERWYEFQIWVKNIPQNIQKEVLDKKLLTTPIPNPHQIFAIGMNYKEHANETVDWEVELVVVICKKDRNIKRENAWNYIAGFTIGQDLSDRSLQFEGNPPQFSLGKSHKGFAPIGPWITTLDEIEKKENLEIQCLKNGKIIQQSYTSNMIFDIPKLIEILSQTVELLPGDLIFTGTPEGVGLGRIPLEYLKNGDVVVSQIEGLGHIIQEFR